MKFFAVAAILAAMTAPSFAEEEVFQGDVFFTGTDIQSDACKPLGFSRYDYLRANFKPANSHNGTKSLLNLLGPRFAYHFDMNGALTGTRAFSAQGFGSHGQAFAWSASMLNASISPSNTLTAKFVTIKFTVQKLGGYAGCNATFTGTLGLRPDL